MKCIKLTTNEIAMINNIAFYQGLEPAPVYLEFPEDRVKDTVRVYREGEEPEEETFSILRIEDHD